MSNIIIAKMAFQNWVKTYSSNCFLSPKRHANMGRRRHGVFTFCHKNILCQLSWRQYDISVKDQGHRYTLYFVSFLVTKKTLFYVRILFRTVKA